jgi:hypothetical protein
MLWILRRCFLAPLLAACSATPAPAPVHARATNQAYTRAALEAAAAHGRRCSRLGPAFPAYPAPPPPGPAGGWPAIEPKPPIDGCLDREVIRRVIRRQLVELRCCGALASRPTRVRLHFLIDRAGRVRDFEPGAEPEAPALQACLAQVVPTWRWRPGGWGGVLVSYPLVYPLVYGAPSSRKPDQKAGWASRRRTLF